MIQHTDLLDDDLRRYIKQNILSLAGNSKLRIYGLLSCSSGKRMKKKNRVFFISQEEAISLGFRPCAHCLPKEYKQWKDGSI